MFDKDIRHILKNAGVKSLRESLDSENGFEIKDDADDMFHKLTLLKDGYTKARCSYTNWGDWISIDWIESFGENKGYATKLLKYIKEQNPDIKEIGGEFVSKRIANLMKKVFGEPLRGNDPEANDYDDYLDDNDKSSCMTFKLNEEIVYASKKDLSDIILKNPTRKELKDNNIKLARYCYDEEGNFYFGNANILTHNDIISSIENKLGIPLYDDIGFYNDNNNCFYIKGYFADEDEYNEELESAKRKFSSESLLKDLFGNFKVDIFQGETPFELYESIVYGSKKDLSDIILMNPTRKELKDNKMDFSRVLFDGGDFYFGLANEYGHMDMGETLSEIGIDCSVDYYGALFYSLSKNTWLYREYWETNEEYQEDKNEVYNWLSNIPYIKENFSNFNVELIKKENYDLYESVYWKGEKINNYEQGYYPIDDVDYDKDDEMIVWKNPSAEWVKHQIDSGEYFRFTYITTTDTLFVWYGENGFHRDTMDITGADGDVVGTMTRDNIDYWPDDDDSPALGDRLFREKREKFLKTIYPNGYDIGVQY